MFFHKPFCDAIAKSNYNIIFTSSERRLDNTGVINNFYNNNELSDLSEKLLTDIIIRCRYLSHINNFLARKLVRRMWYEINDYLKHNKIDIIITSPVDNYVSDIWHKLACRHDIHSFQPRKAPFSNLVRITNSTDNPIIREPSKDEVLQIIQQLSKSFSAGYQTVKIKSSVNIIYKILKEVCK